jgi:hypothetical protein
MNGLNELLTSLRGIGLGIASVAKDDLMPGAVWMFKLLAGLMITSILSSIAAFIVLISAADQTIIIAVLLGSAMITMLASWTIISLTTETLRWGFLAATIAKAIAIDSSLAVIMNAGKALIAVGGLGIAATSSIMRLVAAAVPGVNLEEVNAAFTKNGWEKVEWSSISDPAKNAVSSAIDKFRNYGKGIKAIFIGWLLALTIPFIVNTMGMPTFFNIAANSFLAIFILIALIHRVINSPEKSRLRYFWDIICSGITVFLIWRAINFYFHH